jgi:hypothetical protein
MNPSLSLRTALSTAAVVAAVGAGGAAASSLHAAAVKITPSGVGGVKVGRTYTALRQKGLVGKIHHGCELGGPNTRSANLKSPLKGQVNFTLHAPRKVTDITIRGGATARGVGIGATIAQIKSAFPKAKVDHSTDSTFELTFVRIPKNGGGKIEFGVSTKSHKTTLIGVPVIAVCE